jgi:hypothetical protein
VKISTQIVLNQDEMTEAVLAYVVAQGFVPEGATTEVAFDMGLSDGASSTVTIDAGEEAKGEKKSESQANKPKVTRAPRKPAAAAVETVGGQQSQEPVSEPLAATDNGGEGQTQAEEPPFDVDTPAEVKEDAPAKTTAPAIFANAKSSAAPETPKPSPVMSAKSLFANLSPPANQ